MNQEQFLEETPYGLHTASEAMMSTMDVINDRKNQVDAGTALANIWGIPIIDRYIMPYWKGQLIYVVAMMSNGKSFIARMHALNVLQSLMQNENDGRVVVWITVEEPVEKVMSHWLSVMSNVSSSSIMSGRISDIQLRYLHDYVAEVTTWPLFIVGHSLAKRDKLGIKKRGVLMSRNQIEDCLDFIQNTLKQDIAFMVLDYIQRIDFDDGDYGSMEAHMRHNVDWTRSMATWAACPFEVCAQAPRRVADKAIAIPGMTDVEWTNKAGQDADLMFGALFPKTTNGVGATIEGLTLHNGRVDVLNVTKRHLLVKVAKQREGDAGEMFLLEAYPELMKWELLEPKEINLNPYTGQNMQDSLKRRYGARDDEEEVELVEEQEVIPF